MIYYLGFFLFVFSLLAFLVLSVTRVLSAPAEPGIKYILTALTDSAGNFLSLIAVYIVPFSVVLAVSNLFLIYHEGFRPENILGIILGLFLIAVLVYIRSHGHHPPSGTLEQLTYREITMSPVTSFYLYFECMMIGSVAAGLIAAFYEPEPDKDIVIILGYSLREGENDPTGGRKSAVAIASEGK